MIEAIVNRRFALGIPTVLAWHRRGFQLYWRWKSRARSAGRPPIDVEIRTLIHRMAGENHLGSPQDPGRAPLARL